MGLIVLEALISKLASLPLIWSKTLGKVTLRDSLSSLDIRVLTKSLTIVVSASTPREGLHPKSKSTFSLTTLAAIVFPLVPVPEPYAAWISPSISRSTLVSPGSSFGAAFGSAGL